MNRYGIKLEYFASLCALIFNDFEDINSLHPSQLERALS